jgi:hypothetical protein
MRIFKGKQARMEEKAPFIELYKIHNANGKPQSADFVAKLGGLKRKDHKRAAALDALLSGDSSLFEKAMGELGLGEGRVILKLAIRTTENPEKLAQTLAKSYTTVEQIITNDGYIFGEGGG